MFEAKILTGAWDGGTITLEGMPGDFVLSNRALIVLEEDEYQELRLDRIELLDICEEIASALERNGGEMAAKIRGVLKGIKI